MARIRTIKPEFWTDEDIASLSEPARLLAIGILNQSDDEGYFKAHPMLLKAAVFPLCEPSVDIHGMLSELSNIGYIKLCTGTDGKQYGLVRNFTNHQKVNRPSDSKIKDLCDFTELSMNTHGSLTGGKEQGTGKGKESKGKTLTSTSQAKIDPREDEINGIFEYWRKTMNKDSRAKLTQKRKSKVNARLEDGFTPREICLAIKGCAMSPHHMGDNDTGAIYDDLELICRDDAKVKRFISIAQKQQQPYSSTTAKNIETLNNMEFD